jgi:polyisoprenoid-binding protein YceI
MKLPILALRITAAAAALSFAVAASAELASIGAADVQFLAIGPAGMKINGTSNKLSASESDGKLTLTAPLTNLKTGIGLRDKHLRGYLATDKHPKATLVVERSKLKEPADNQTVSGSATGQFTMHGVTKPVKFEYKAKRTGSDFHVQGRTQIDIRDFKVEVPCYLGVCVEPQIKIKAKLKLRDKG